MIVSSVSPFSDRLMLFHTNLLNTAGIAGYGLALSNSMRMDIQLVYLRVMLQVGLFTRKGAKLLVKRGWLEKPPTAPDRERIPMVGEISRCQAQPALKPMGNDDDIKK